MPRKGKGGGARQGSPGTAYSNRSDLNMDRAQPAQAKKGQTYGDRGRQEASMTEMPLPDIAGQAAVLPGLADPSARPDEPLTAGMPMGPGPGPLPGSMPGATPGGDLLRAMLAATGDPELFELVAEADRMGF